MEEIFERLHGKNPYIQVNELEKRGLGTQIKERRKNNKSIKIRFIILALTSIIHTPYHYIFLPSVTTKTDIEEESPHKPINIHSYPHPKNPHFKRNSQYITHGDSENPHAEN